MLDYYLGWITEPGPAQPALTPPSSDSLKFAAKWGLPTAIDDVRHVVRARGARASAWSSAATRSARRWRRSTRRGTSTAGPATATSTGSCSSTADARHVRAGPTRAQLKRRLAADAQASRSPTSSALGLPWAQGVFAQIGRRCTRTATPQATSPFRNSELLPQQFQPPFPATNRGDARIRVRRDDLARGPRADPRARRPAAAPATRATGSTARSRRSTASPDVRRRAGQRHRVVLPAAAVDRRRRGVSPLTRDRGDEVARAAPVPPRERRPAALRDADRPHERPRPARRARFIARRGHRGLGATLVDASKHEPPRPADRRAREQRLPQTVVPFLKRLR